MEPAMAVCAGLAAVALSLGAVGSVPAAARRIGAICVPVPVRPVAAFALVVTLMSVACRPRSAAATVAPPVVRLAEQADVERYPETAPAPPSATDAGSAPATYVVRPGDSLWRIAERVLADRHGNPSSADIARFWPDIYDANIDLIGANPDLILPGQHLHIPEA
jgi:nucleoid-associated protein YgaU